MSLMGVKVLLGVFTSVSCRDAILGVKEKCDGELFIKSRFLAVIIGKKLLIKSSFLAVRQCVVEV